jgi:hypothetical protein
MDRRNFLKSMGALAATAAGMPSFAAITEPNKYAESLRLLDACRGITDPEKAAGPVNQLLAYLRENFAPPENTEANYAACALLLQTPYDQLESIARGIPPDIADELYPVALVRLGLIVYQIPMDPDRVTDFDWFHKTYGKVIIQGSDVKRKPGYRKPPPKTEQDLRNEALTQLNKETAWSQEDMKLYNIKGQA